MTHNVLFLGRLCYICWVACSIAVGAAISAAAAVTLRYLTSTHSSPQKYSPTDTRIIPHSWLLCQDLQVSSDVTNSTAVYDISLYMLRSQPNLTGHETFSTRGVAVLKPGSEYERSYYFYPGSHLTMSACIRSQNHNNHTATFYLIQGLENLKQWRKNPLSRYYKGSFEITATCNSTVTSNASNSTYKVSISTEGYHYLVFSGGKASIDLQVDLSVFRTQYEITNSSIIHSCSYQARKGARNNCSVGIPLSSAVAYVSIQPHKGQEVSYWDSELHIRTTCIARYWVYALGAVAIAVLVAAVLNSVLCIYVCWRARDRKRMLKPLGVNYYDPTTPLMSESSSCSQQDYSSCGNNHSASPTYSSFPVY